VWIRVIGARQRYEPRAKFTTWLYRIAHNRVIDHYRSDKPGRIRSLDEEASEREPAANPGDEPEGRVMAQRQAAHLRELVAELPPEQRDAFLLHALPKSPASAARPPRVGCATRFRNCARR
jgi:RNA polymerase sigma-70 factor (ECF subfamily)